MVNKKIATRDYLRSFITKANKAAGVNFNSSKLNSKEECENYILNLIKDLRHKPQNNKAYIKEIDDLKEEMGILNNSLLATKKANENLESKIKRLESKEAFYITQAEEAGRQRAIFEDNYYDEKERSFKLKLDTVKNKRKLAFSKILLASASVFIVLEFIIIILLLRGVY